MGPYGGKRAKMVQNDKKLCLFCAPYLRNHASSGDNTEKYGRIGFLTKSKTIAAGGLGGVVSPQGGQGDALVKVWVQSP